MKKFLPNFLIGLLFGGLVAWFLLRQHAAAPAGHEAPAPAAESEPPPVGTVHLDKNQLAAAGLQITAPAFETVTPEITAYGRVLDPAPLLAAAADVATARAALAASDKEFQRAQSLHENGENASAQSVETARAAAERDRIQLDAARARLLTAWGPQLVRAIDANHLAAELARGWTLARIDIPADATLRAPPKSANLTLLTDRAKLFAAEILGPAPMADPQFQGRGYLALVRGESLPIGAALQATLSGAGDPSRLAVLPRSAFVRHGGSVFVFVQTGDGTFARRLVELGPELDHGTAVTRGVGERDRVVVVGAQQLLSAELGAGGGDED
ncbi:MAG TPA: efflux RND transporter periplasmic adaptor subunit [Opitutus sp.]|nr:efflux RND transporter periplasmic adaptor subunit [Opitutus sp.]